MARRGFALARRSAVRVVKVPQVRVIRALGGRAMRGAGRGISAAARAARSEKHTIAAVGAAAVLGLTDRLGVNLPTLPVLGKAGTYGLAAWMAGRYMRSQTMQHIATGLLAVAAHQMASGGSISGDEGEI